MLFTLRNLDALKKTITTQDLSLVSQAPKLEKSHGTISWSTMSADHVYTLFRALSPKIRLSSSFRGKQIHLLNVRGVQRGGDGLEPGMVRVTPCGRYLVVKCLEDRVVVGAVKVEGRNEVGAKAFWNGYKSAEVRFI
ncbi:hypothetical protein BC829DRAFT_102574 [Chytridium lagenaria]|nr:hypothetical protein BC829DRAFT_102574 [Chytridium lagenaria]